MKKLLFLLFLSLAYQAYGQIGIGTSTPRGALDINRPTTNTYGLVLPTNLSTANMRNPQGGRIAPATMMFESSSDCIKYFKSNAWTNCLLTDIDSQLGVSKVVQTTTFNGTYRSNVAMTASNTFVIGIKNDSPTAVTISLSTLDLKLSGVTGLSVSSVSPTSITIQPGQTRIVTYTLSGTTPDCGLLTGTWKKMKLTHTATTDVAVNPTYQCNSGTWNNTVLPEHRLNGLTNGQSYTGTYTIPYTNGGQCPLPAETLTNQGLTVTYTGGDIGTSGEVTYTLSGTYTGPDNGSASFTTARGCVIYLGPRASCKEILQLFPESPDGLYYINFNKTTTPDITRLYCDMTTDGGGWGLIAVNGTSFRNQTQKTIITGLNDNGYLPRTTVIKVATIGTQVQLRSGTSATNYANKLTSQAGGAVIVALRSTSTTNLGWGTWHSSSARTDFKNNTAIPPIGTWNFEGTCTPSGLTGWPSMYHSCGINANIHWLMNLASSNRTSDGDPWSSTWVR